MKIQLLLVLLAVLCRGQAVKFMSPVPNIYVEMKDLRTLMGAMKSEVGNLKKENAAMNASLENLKQENTALKTSLETLNKANKVAFSAALPVSDDALGPYDDDATTLVYSKVITNVGAAYNNLTGVFTAPVRGVYYFRFTAYSLLTRSYPYLSLQMNKNKESVAERVMYLVSYDEDGHYHYVSSGVTLQLEVGDDVYMFLPGGQRLYEKYEGNHRNSFSGFLVFPM